MAMLTVAFGPQSKGGEHSDFLGTVLGAGKYLEVKPRVDEALEGQECICQPHARLGQKQGSWESGKRGRRNTEGAALLGHWD